MNSKFIEFEFEIGKVMLENCMKLDGLERKYKEMYYNNEDVIYDNQGRLTKTPVMEDSNTGKSVTSFTISSDGTSQGQTNLISRVAWCKNAEFEGKELYLYVDDDDYCSRAERKDV